MSDEAKLRAALDVALSRTIHICPGYDQRSTIPSQNYGIHNAEIQFVLSGPEGAVVFTIRRTGWYVASAREYFRSVGRPRQYYLEEDKNPWCCSIDVHSKVPLYEDQDPIADCKFTNGDCYCDSTVMVEDLMERLVAEGEDPVWTELEAWYREKLQHSLVYEI